MKPQSVKIFFIIFPLYFKKLACFNQFSKIRFLGPHFYWRRSLLGPHLIQNWVPILDKIGSLWHLGAVQRTDEQGDSSWMSYSMNIIYLEKSPLTMRNPL